MTIASSPCSQYSGPPQLPSPASHVPFAPPQLWIAPPICVAPAENLKVYSLQLWPERLPTIASTTAISRPRFARETLTFQTLSFSLSNGRMPPALLFGQQPRVR